MKKICILFLTFFFSYTAHAGLEGFGDIKLSPYSVDQLEKYLSDYNKNKKARANQRGTGLVFLFHLTVSLWLLLLSSRRSCTPDEAKQKTTVKEMQKKRLEKKKNKCNTFASKRKIVWNNVNRVVPKNVDVKEFINKLRN